MEIFTAGFTKWTAEELFNTLKREGIERLVDVRLHNTSQLAGFAKRDDLGRVRFEDAHGNMNLRLTDVRFYDRSGALRNSTVRLVERRLADPTDLDPAAD